MMDATRIGSDRPSLKDLHEHVVIQAAGKWRDLGVCLLSQPDQAEMITADHSRDAVSCCKGILEKWLDTTTDATWDQLIRALRSPSIQLDHLAGQLEQMLITECKGDVLARVTTINNYIKVEIIASQN